MRLSIPGRAGLVGVVVIGLTIPAQLWLVSRWSGEERSLSRMALVIAAGWAVGMTCVLIFATYIVGHRTRRLARVLNAIREGNLRGDLEPLLDSDLGTVRGALVSMRTALDDLTTKLRYVDEQRRRLFADLAHELATPTSTIMATAETLATPSLCKTDEDRARVAACLDEEATRLSRLIRDVRDLARLDDPDVALEAESIDVADLARRAAERLNLANPARAAIRCTIAAVPAVDADRIRIDQVLMNLLTNAQRHCPPDGAIHLEVGPAAVGGVQIVVEDSGDGVPDDLLPRLGERLLRVDPSRATESGGSGLGLSIVVAAVHRHGGTLRFERASLGGLRAMVHLPGGGGGDGGGGGGGG